MFTFDCTTSDIVVVTTRSTDMFTLDVTTSDIIAVTTWSTDMFDHTTSDIVVGYDLNYRYVHTRL